MASAAPAAPKPRVKMKIGFKTMLMIVPVIEAFIDSTASPSVRKMLLGARPKTTKAAPQAITM